MLKSEARFLTNFCKFAFRPEFEKKRVSNKCKNCYKLCLKKTKLKLFYKFCAKTYGTKNNRKEARCPVVMTSLS